MEIVNDLKERNKRSVLRSLQRGDIEYDANLDKLVYADTHNEYDPDGDNDSDDDY